jgi:hypothetical protein
MPKGEDKMPEETKMEPQVDVPAVYEPTDTKPQSYKFSALIMTLFPLSLANWLIFGVLYIILTYSVIPYRVDPYSGEMVPDWKASMPFTLALYFPISFAYHYVIKSGLW